jgi:hypothetical protein
LHQVDLEAVTWGCFAAVEWKGLMTLWISLCWELQCAYRLYEQE